MWNILILIHERNRNKWIDILSKHPYLTKKTVSCYSAIFCIANILSFTIFTSPSLLCGHRFDLAYIDDNLRLSENEDITLTCCLTFGNNRAPIKALEYHFYKELSQI